jgi:hypothetical protein
MGTVLIGSDTYNIYGTRANADMYINAMFGAAATKWRNLSVDDDKDRTLVVAARYLDTLGLEDAGVAITYTTVLTAIHAAQAELAVLIASDPTVVEAIDAGSNIRVLDADGTKIEFFRPTSAAAGTATRLPVVVQRLLAPYLPATDLVIVGGAAFGTDVDSQFDDCDDGDRSDPF